MDDLNLTRTADHDSNPVTDDEDIWMDSFPPEEMHLRYHNELQISYIEEHSEWVDLPDEYVPDVERGHFPPTFAWGFGLANSRELFELARKFPDPLPNHDSSLIAAFKTIARHFKQEGLDAPLQAYHYFPKPPNKSSFVFRLMTNYNADVDWRPRCAKTREILKELDPSKKFGSYLLMINFWGDNEGKENWCPGCRLRE